jgi:hypothetical protein
MRRTSPSSSGIVIDSNLRLANAAQQAGVDWAYWIGETEENQ